MGANISELSPTAASNTALGAIGIQGTDLVSTADDAFRAAAAILAKFYDDFGGTAVIAGTANAITITTTTTYTALATGMVVWIIPTADNTTAATANLDANGAKAIRRKAGGTDIALVGGDLRQGRPAMLIYDAAANSAAGAWILINPGNVHVEDGGSVNFAAGNALLTHSNASPNGVVALTGTFTASQGATITQASATALTVNRTGASNGNLAEYQKAGSTKASVQYDGTSGLFAADGFKFPATQVAAADANTLDDYEEGTTNPTVTASIGTFTSVSCTLTYTKIGNRVCWEAAITITTAGTAAGSITLPLPFTPGATAPMAGFELSTALSVIGLVASGSANATVVKYDGTTIIGSGRTVYVGGTYRV